MEKAWTESDCIDGCLPVLSVLAGSPICGFAKSKAMDETKRGIGAQKKPVSFTGLTGY
ncbi:hypothetical protein [Aneurinibacillus uraniidurans]|uniref:hypothetical protein n=1 Tax=Aneurinibacillus uraniidurans TaxID=2966586 RepID=UPI00234BCB35|nr:hypothetical protein [Aneurinibacillus sp. B1]WCN39347.1 hypothetical protein PO771_08125 [Aneurinibacillus sp. B1]